MKLIIEKTATKEQKERKRVIIEAPLEDRRKLESFVQCMKDVAEDMGIKAYVDTTEYLIGADY